MMSSRRWFWLALLFSALFLCAPASLNYVMDPFSKRGKHWLEYDRSGANRDFNVPLWSIYSVGRLPSEDISASEVIVLGDSRATLLTKEGKEFRLTDHGGRKVLNLSLGGGSLQENIAFFRSEESRAGGFRNLKTLVFTAPFNRICEVRRPDRIEQAIPMRENGMLYYFSGYTLKRSLLSLRAIGKRKDQVRKQLTKADGEKALKSWVRTYRGFDENLARVRYDRLEAFATELKERGVSVIFYMPPGGGSGRRIVSEVGLLDEYDAFLTRMDEIGHVENWAEASGINGEPFLYEVGDPIHHDKGASILERILKNVKLKKASK